jgi:hypothetical protein
VVQGVITTAKSRALVGDAYCEKTISVARWNFPAGGPWTRDTSAVNVLVGAAISQK